MSDISHGTRRSIAIIIISFLTSCLSLQTRHKHMLTAIPTDPVILKNCNSLDNKQIGWAVSAIVFGSLSGGTGLTAGVLPDNSLKYIPGIISIVLAVGTGISTFLTSRYTQRFAEQCKP